MLGSESSKSRGGRESVRAVTVCTINRLQHPSFAVGVDVIITQTAIIFVNPGATVEDIAPIAATQGIIAVAAVHAVVAAATLDFIGAIAAADDIVAAFAVDDVIAA